MTKVNEMCCRINGQFTITTSIANKYVTYNIDPINWLTVANGSATFAQTKLCFDQFRLKSC